jgi:ubiquinone/menaquinone biosynthesis C-methylase UbiE
VLSLGTLEHVQYPEHSLQELRRVLEPAGMLYVYKLPNRFSYVERLARRTGRYWHGKWEHDRVYTRHTARQMIQKSGFDVLSAQYRNMVPLRATGHLLHGHGTSQVRAVSDALAAVPLVRNLATNVEVVARRRG